VRIDSVRPNNKRRVFEIELGGKCYPFPYEKSEVVPTPDDPVVSTEIDWETAYEGFVYHLASGAEGYVHGEQALDYNRDPEYMRELLIYQLTLEANDRIKKSRLSKREIIRRLGTSPAQFYRLADPTYYGKTVDAMLELLRALDCEIEVVVRDLSA
jgi:predicted XRE-type DNA-binding protein